MPSAEPVSSLESATRFLSASSMAARAASAAPVPEGSVGAGAGATIGKAAGAARAMKGGIGTASIEVGGITVAALVAVNAIGDVVDPRSGRIVAGARSVDGRTLLGTMRALKRGELPARLDARHAAGSATTLAVVATDAVLTKAETNKVAQMAHDGLARSIHPVHTMGDGDVVFALATGAARQAAMTTLVGALAADVLADAVLRAVRAARRIGGKGLPDLPAAADLGGTAESLPGDPR
jgi:L-aminopeptidase/D-esterase-like protein